MARPSKRCSLCLWTRAMDGMTPAPIFFIAAGLTAYFFLPGRVRYASGQSRTWLPRLSRSALAAVAAGTFILPDVAIALEALGPESIPDVAEQVVEAVVGISTSPRVDPRNNAQDRPPSINNDELFRDFFEPRGQRGRNNQRNGSVGSGFIVDAQ